jgi:Zn-dependent peptidase ImmA (M78 family)
MSLTRAERLLKELGITEPDEIDLEAIAFYVGARIRYRSLDGYDARIIGYGDEAIITINRRSTFQRQRFSIGHELGHWEHHRGQKLDCRVEGRESALASERLADAYAANLLMPNYLFRPLALQQSKLNFKAVSTLADTFKTSQTATAIRLVETDHSPVVLVCHDTEKRKWHVKAPSVPAHWIPKRSIDTSSSALEVLYGKRDGDLAPRKIKAEAWFDCWEARGHDVYEQTMRIGDGEILTILLTDRRMLEERN